MPISARSGTWMLWLAALLGGCGEAVEVPFGRFADNPTPYQHVLALIDAGSQMPAAGDDLTLYLSGRFDKAPSQQAALGDSSQIGL